jgi:hypothetical protein
VAAPASDVRRSEIVAALSMATDLAIGQPVEFALKSCVLGVRLGEAAGLGTDEIVEIYYQPLAGARAAVRISPGVAAQPR